MEKTHKKLSIAPPEGEALARYTVNVKPSDVFKRRIFCHVLPMFVRNAVKIFLMNVALYAVQWFIAFVISQFMGIHDRVDRVIDQINGKIAAFGWLFAAVFWIYAAVLLIQVVIAAVKARTEATKEAERSLPEDYAFFETGLIYSNGRDLIHIEWKDIRLLTVSSLGLILHAGKVCDTLFIPPRYLCTEFPPLSEALKKALGLRYIRLKKTVREHEPMYENPREKIAIEAPEGDKIGEVTVSLRLWDLGYLYNMWCRQIGRKYHRGLFGILFLLLLGVVFAVATFLLEDAVFLPMIVASLALMILYALYVSVSSMLYGKRLLVNRGDYKKPVRYVFYPAGFLMIYSGGISHVTYEDLDLIFEDDEGLGFFFSKKQCLFLPSRVMRSTDGVRLSHYFKASLFNLDPER